MSCLLVAGGKEGGYVHVLIWVEGKEGGWQPAGGMLRVREEAFVFRLALYCALLCDPLLSVASTTNL